jgi:prepilin signal peptidase PulO-like enzyme (type II secretory pathway)
VAQKVVFLLVLFVPIYLASLLSDLLTMGVTRLVMLLMLLVSLAAVYHFGVPEEVADWIEAGRHAELSLALSIAVASAVILTRYWIMRRRFLRLQWPHEMSWFRFRRWCKQFLVRQGWETSAPERHTVMLSFVARKGAIAVNVICAVDAPTHDILKQCYWIGDIVFVCLSTVPDSTVVEAAQLGVRILEYKGLERFDQILAGPLQSLPAGAELEPSAAPLRAWEWLRSSEPPKAVGGNTT